MGERMATGIDLAELVLADARRWPFLAETLTVDSPGDYTAARKLIDGIRELRKRSNGVFVGPDPRRELVLGHLIDAEGTIRGKMAQYLDCLPE